MPARRVVFTFMFLLSRTRVSRQFRFSISPFKLILVVIFVSPCLVSIVGLTTLYVHRAGAEGGLHLHALAIANQGLTAAQVFHLAIQVDLGRHFGFSFVPRDTHLNASVMPKPKTRA